LRNNRIFTVIRFFGSGFFGSSAASSSLICEEKEYELFSRHTGVPVSEIPNAFQAYEKLFPMKNGWFSDLGPNCKVERIKMMSVPFMGIGANVRRLAYAAAEGFDKIPTGGQFTIKDLKTWNNVTVELLRS
jgi:hypothetical protein